MRVLLLLASGFASLAQNPDVTVEVLEVLTDVVPKPGMAYTVAVKESACGGEE